MRRQVHAAFAVSATYSDQDVNPPVAVSLRWQNKAVQAVGGIGDYAAVLDNIDKVIFDTDELIEKGITPVRKGEIVFTEYNGYALVLDQREPADGPIKQVWTVSRPSGQQTEL